MNKMSKCEVCKNFIDLRKKIFDDLGQTKYDTQIKLWLYYNNPEVNDEKFENAFQLCKQCYNETCRQLKPCDNRIKKFTEEDAPNELTLRKKKKIQQIQSNKNCKTCDDYYKKLKGLQNLTDKQVEEWLQSCLECTTLCKKNVGDDMYCRQASANAEVAEKRKEERRLKNIEKLYNIEKIQRQLKKK